MDDLANELGISKKTLYQNFSDKQELVQQAVKFHFDADQKICDDLIAAQENPIKQILSIGQHISKTLREMNPATMYDLHKYYPEAWEYADKHREEYVINCVKANIELGIEQGWYRSELEPDRVSRFYIHLIETLMHADQYYGNQVDYPRLLTAIMDYHIHALLTEKGRKIYKKLLNPN